MRADRLISLVMILQTRGRATAEELATELEVSVRTIYRDLIALSTSGVPVYTESGPGGGVGLVEEYRTSLTGLTPEEARALFMMGVPAPLAQLGFSREFKQALLKLSAALPDSRRGDETHIRQRILLDSSWWFQGNEALPYLAVIQKALWEDCRLHLKIRQEFFNAEFELEVEPYGLVAKANVWHLVYGHSGGLRVLPIDEVIGAEMMEDKFIRPPDFDLQSFWQEWCKDYENFPPFVAQVRISPEILPSLHYYLGPRWRKRLSTALEKKEDGWVTLELQFDSLINARTVLLGLGRAVEVLGPEPLRKSLVDFAEQVLELYKERTA